MYQQEETETWLGEWIKARGNRDQLVYAALLSTPHSLKDMVTHNALPVSRPNTPRAIAQIIVTRSRSSPILWATR